MAQSRLLRFRRDAMPSTNFEETEKPATENKTQKISSCVSSVMSGLRRSEDKQASRPKGFVSPLRASQNTERAIKDASSKVRVEDLLSKLQCSLTGSRRDSSKPPSVAAGVQSPMTKSKLVGSPPTPLMQ